MQRVLLPAHEIDGMVVRPAAEKSEKLATPIRNAKSEDLNIEIDDRLDIRDSESDVAELERHDSCLGAVLGRVDVVCEDVHASAFGVFERQRAPDAWRD